MPRTRLTKVRLNGHEPMSLVFTALTADTEYDFVFEGGEQIYVEGAGAIVLESVADLQGRFGDITHMNADAGNPIAVYGPFNYPGWRQSDGTFHISAVSGSVSLSVVAPAR